VPKSDVREMRQAELRGMRRPRGAGPGRRAAREALPVPAREDDSPAGFRPVAAREASRRRERLWSSALSGLPWSAVFESFRQPLYNASLRFVRSFAPYVRSRLGPLAQLGERLVRNQEVAGSIPARSTNLRKLTKSGVPQGCLHSGHWWPRTKNQHAVVAVLPMLAVEDALLSRPNDAPVGALRPHQAARRRRALAGMGAGTAFSMRSGSSTRYAMKLK
jgi:hypothetical protein